jgi:Cofactor assembly of complex C subunit B, CCB2/CCB4
MSMRDVVQVVPEGKEVSFVREGLRKRTQAELWWAWEALSSATCCCSQVVFHTGVCVLQAGVACQQCTAGCAEPGKMCEEVIERGKANYLGNLALVPGAHSIALQGKWHGLRLVVRLLLCGA